MDEEICRQQVIWIRRTHTEVVPTLSFRRLRAVRPCWLIYDFSAFALGLVEEPPSIGLKRDATDACLATDSGESLGGTSRVWIMNSLILDEASTPFSAISAILEGPI